MTLGSADRSPIYIPPLAAASIGHSAPPQPTRQLVTEKRGIHDRQCWGDGDVASYRNRVEQSGTRSASPGAGAQQIQQFTPFRLRVGRRAPRSDATCRLHLQVLPPRAGIQLRLTWLGSITLEAVSPSRRLPHHVALPLINVLQPANSIGNASSPHSRPVLFDTVPASSGRIRISASRLIGEITMKCLVSCLLFGPLGVTPNNAQQLSPEIAPVIQTTNAAKAYV